MSRGKFITFEGGEGVGKSTQARLLGDAFDSRGIDCELTREPGGTEGAEAIRKLLLDHQADAWSPEAEALLFAAARSDHVSRFITPLLQDDRWVICDRFIDSTRAYQGGGGGLSDDQIMQLHQIGSEGLLPDLTILLTIDPERAEERLAARDRGESDRIGGREAEYHARVAARFLALAEAEPKRFVIIDGEGNPEDVHLSILREVERKFGLQLP